MMDRFRRRVALVAGMVLAAALASCGGGGGGGGGGSDGGGGGALSGNYFPLDAGARWRYAVDGGNAFSARVTGPDSNGVVSGTVIETNEDGSFGRSPSRRLYVVSSDGVRQYALPAPTDPIGRALDGLRVMAFPLRAGDAFTQVDTTVDSGLDFDDDGRSDRIALRATIDVIGLEAIATGAGTFTDALHQRQTITEKVTPSGGSSSVTVTIVIDTWYGNGVGELVSTLRITGAGIDESGATRVTAYGVGSRRSDSVAPVVDAVTPTLPVRAAVTSVAATLSERVDRYSLAADALTVRDGSGVLVAGEALLQADEATVRFYPAGPWLAGTYTAVLAGVTDLVGNPVATRTWSFTVDDMAPGVVASSPAMDAVDVPLAISAITVDFSEPLDPASINAGNTVLLANGVQVPVMVSVAGNRVTLAPTGPLALRTTYEAQVTAFDIAGNPFVHRLVFRTSQGRFAFPASLVRSVVPPAVAIGDVTGDGIPDVLLAANDNLTGTGANGLYLLAGSASGTLGAPRRIDTGSQLVCPLAGLAIGDLDGDGRADVAVSGYGCGVQVLRQTAGGALALAEFLPATQMANVAIADLDGDGKPELVGSGNGSEVVRIWKRSAGGAMALATTLPLPLATKDLALGDIDGNGRIDIVVALANGGTAADIGVLLQQADGSFVSSFLTVGDDFGLNRIAVGDLDGDGRAEIVAAGGYGYVAVYRSTGGGAFAAPVRLRSSGSASSPVIADVDNDGRPDLIVGQYSPARVAFYRQQADGTFLAEELFVADEAEFVGVQSLAVADVTGDGFRDVVFNGQLIRQHAGGGNGPSAAPPGDRQAKATRALLRATLRR